jgi:hypothetical protein
MAAFLPPTSLWLANRLMKHIYINTQSYFSAQKWNVQGVFDYRCSDQLTMSCHGASVAAARFVEDFLLSAYFQFDHRGFRCFGCPSGARQRPMNDVALLLR